MRHCSKDHTNDLVFKLTMDLESCCTICTYNTMIGADGIVMLAYVISASLDTVLGHIYTAFFSIHVDDINQCGSNLLGIFFLTRSAVLITTNGIKSMPDELHFTFHVYFTGYMIGIFQQHDDVIKWKHFSRYWPLVREIHRSPVNSPHKGQWRGALMFHLICVWINS